MKMLVSVLGLLLLLSCGPTEKGIIYTTTEMAMGTWIQLTVQAPDSITARKWIRIAGRELHRIGFELWEGEPAGKLGRLNRERYTDDAELIKLVNYAFSLYEMTKGSFDPRVGATVAALGFVDKAYPDGPVDGLDQLQDAASRLQWLRHGDGFKLEGSNATLALGGLAKGYAVDRVVQMLQGVGCGRGMVNAGGDLRAWGGTHDNPWLVAIEDPGGGDHIAWISIQDGAIATSGNYRAQYIREGDTLSHLIDPHSGRSSRAHSSVSVYASECITADGWATGLYVMAPMRAKRLAAKHTDIGLLQITRTGEIMTDPDFAELLSSSAIL